MKKFREYISEEVVPTALVKDGSIDLEKEDVRASINMALAKVTADGSITPYIALNRISKALAMFHIILPKRIYLEGGKGVEVHELRQFGMKMGMTDSGEFVNEVPGRFFLFIQYGLNTPMNSGSQYAYPTMGGTFRVVAKVVDQIELNRLLDMAEITMSEEAECRQMTAKAMAPKEPMHDITSDEKKKGNKEAVAASEKGLDEEQIDELSYETVARYHRKAAERFHTGEEPEEKREKGREMATRKRAGGTMGIPKAKVMAKEETISEKAPPGAKFERMVKHIKKGYSKDGLTAKEKSIAYATAWKAKNKESKD
jgi:hypothetical protein